MFHWDNGLKLTEADLAIDVRRRQPRAFISHAHSDHIARHEYAICTPETAALYQHRLGPRPTKHLPYRTPLDWSGLRLTTFPAGHCLGSAMLLADDGRQTMLYTGDFKLGESATAERAELPHADLLVIESTFGTPEYRMPPRDEVVAQLIALVRQTLDDRAVPVILAYSLGKSQEVTRLLTTAGIPVMQHRDIFEVSKVYEKCGVDLGQFECYQGTVPPGWALIVPPGKGAGEKLGRQVRIAATGWAVNPRAKYQLRVDHALPLSDHADYDELFEAVVQVSAHTVYCTHGPASFVDRLRDAGFNAKLLGKSDQQRLF